MLGELAAKLVEDAQRGSLLEKFPQYSGELVRAVARETRELYTKAEEDEPGTRIEQARRFVLQLAILRNKRCMLAYQHHRAQHLQQEVWAQSDPDFKVLSGPEQTYLREYAELVTEYKGEWTNVDLSESLEPPAQIYVEVRVLQDAGEIESEYGVFHLTKGSQFFVRQADVQRLIQQGLVERVQ